MRKRPGEIVKEDKFHREGDLEIVLSSFFIERGC
jgi:hypothetical protein